MKNKYHVIIENNGEFIHYDILPYLGRVWSDLRPKDRKIALTDLPGWIDKELKYQFWGRCQYEVILESWPTGGASKKIDVYWQSKADIELITKLFIENEGITV